MKTLKLTAAESRAYSAGERCFWRAMRHPEYFGCLTGDCPHSYQRDCDESIAALLVPDCPYGTPGDRIELMDRNVKPHPKYPKLASLGDHAITAITVEQRDSKWGWLLEVGA